MIEMNKINAAADISKTNIPSITKTTNSTNAANIANIANATNTANTTHTIHTANTTNTANTIHTTNTTNTMNKINTSNTMNTTGKADMPNEMDGLSQDEIERLENMPPELKNALLRLRKNIRTRRLEKEQAAEHKEMNRLMGIKTPEEEAEERSARNLRLAIKEQEEHNREAVKKKYLTAGGMEEAGIPAAFRTAAMENIIRRGIPEPLEYIHMRICDYLANIDKCCQQGTGLILTGPCGTLKTTFACSIMLTGFKHCIESRFELVMSLLDRLVMLEKTNNEEYCRTMRRLCTVPLLVLDDMGAEGRHADFVRSKLEQIIFQRHANNKSIIITTNLTPNAMAGMYTSRVMDRLRERCLVLEHKCNSLRQQNLFSLTPPDSLATRNSIA